MGLFNFKNIFKKDKKEVEIYEKGLEKTRKEFTSKLNLLTLKHNKINEEYFEELEEILISADIGVNTVMEFIDKLKKRVKHENIMSASELKEIIVDEMFIIYVGNDIIVNKINYAEKGPTVLLFVGVNGVGKTTTIGKIAYKLKNEGKKVLLIAGDTFRAGAVEQLNEWGEKIGCDTIYKENADKNFYEELNETHTLYKYENKKPFKIYKDNNIWVIEGKEIEDLFLMTRFNEDESILRFARKLKKMGVEDELEKLGAKRGEEVKILDYIFNFKE